MQQKHWQFLRGFLMTLVFFSVVIVVLFGVLVLVDLIAGPVGG